MPGYSGTPLAKKLGLKPQTRVSFYKVPAAVLTECKASLESCRQVARGPVDFAMLFSTASKELENEFVPLAHRLESDGMLWVAWPKKSSGVASDLDENKVREIGLKAGLVDVKVCAVTDVWSGLKFVYRLTDRRKRGQVG